MKIFSSLMHACAALVLLQLQQASAQYKTSDHGDMARQFHIDAGEARFTLNEFSRQSGLQLLYDFNAVSGIRTRELNGKMEPASALRWMIDGTQLAFEFVNGATVAVLPAKTPSGPRPEK